MILGITAGSPAASGPPPDTDPDYASVGYLLHGDGANGGTVFTDSGPNAATITRIGSGIVTSTAWQQFGSASIYSPASSGNRIQLPDGNAAYRGAGGAWTFEASLYRDVGGTSQVLMDGNNDNSNSSGPIIYINPADKLALYDGPGGADRGAAGTSIPVETLCRVRVVWTGEYLLFYVEGELDQSVDTFTNTWGSSSGPSLFGDKNSTPSQCYRGFADEVRFTRMARSTGDSYALEAGPFADE